MHPGDEDTAAIDTGLDEDSPDTNSLDEDDETDLDLPSDEGEEADDSDGELDEPRASTGSDRAPDGPRNVHAETRRVVRTLEEVRRALRAALAELPAREAWRRLHDDVIAGRLAVESLWHTPPFEDDATVRPQDELGAIVALIERAAQPVDPVFDEPLPDSFVRRRLLRLVERVAPDARTIAHLRDRVPATTDAAFLVRLARTHERLRSAEDAMMRLHAGLVGWIVPRFEGRGMDHEDLVQEAMAGLLRGVRRFRPERGTHFSTYALFWIRATLERAMANQSRLVRLPVHLQESLTRVKKAADEFERRQRRRPEPEELVSVTSLDLGQIRHLLDLLRFRAVSIEGDEEGTPALGQVLADASQHRPDELLLALGDRTTIEAALATLTPREREIIVRRFGLDGAAEETLEQIGARHGVTRERIRQLQNKAMERLRMRLQRARA